MKTTILTLFAVLSVFLWSSQRAAAQDEGAPAGEVVTARTTVLHAQPKPSGQVVLGLDAGTKLRWIMGLKSNGYLRAMVPNGPQGWVPESDIDPAQTLNIPPAAPPVIAAAQACATTLNVCPDNGCSAGGSPHALANSVKKRLPIGTTPVVLSFQDFASLQHQATTLVDMGKELDASQRAKLKNLQVSGGVVQEGSLVRIMAGLSDGIPHPNTGESVNCNLSGPANNDFHVAVTAVPGASEFDGIVVEMIPQARPANWSLAKVQALKGKALLIEGALLYDNLHFVNSDPGNPMPGQPKRFSLWEIHRVTSVKVCKVKASLCKADNASQWTVF